MVFFVIPMMNGIISDIQGFELYEDAEAHAIDVAKTYDINANDYADIEEQINRVADGRGIYIESGPYFDAESGSSYNKYLFKFKGEFILEENLIKELKHHGYEPDEENLYRWVQERQNYIDIDPITDLLYQVSLDYRNGEKYAITFAQDDLDAVDRVVAKGENWEMWTILNK